MTGDLLASSCSFVTLDIKESLILPITDRIKEKQGELAIRAILEADALMRSINLEAEVTSSPQFQMLEPGKDIFVI